MADLDDIQRIAAREVRFFLQRVPRASSHTADLQQEAILALLTASRSFNPALGSWNAYASSTVQKAVGRYLLKARGGRRAPVLVPLEVAGGVPTQEDCPAEQLDRRRVAARVRAVLGRLDYHPKRVGVANALGEGTPQELAKRLRVPVKDIYYARAQLVRRASRALPMRALLEELRP